VIYSDEEMDYAFSETSDSSDSTSLTYTGRSDGPYREQFFNIKTILDQLRRMSASIREFRTRQRYENADLALKQRDYSEFETHLLAIILSGNTKETMPQPASHATRKTGSTESMQLTAVHRRLIHANLVRHNRIMYATRATHSIKTQQAHNTKRLSLIEEEDLSKQLGAIRGYPPYPKPEPNNGDSSRCPYCAELLPAGYSNSKSKWK
jgi:hypothetical protein